MLKSIVERLGVDIAYPVDIEEELEQFPTPRQKLVMHLGAIQRELDEPLTFQQIAYILIGSASIDLANQKIRTQLNRYGFAPVSDNTIRKVIDIANQNIAKAKNPNGVPHFVTRKT